MRQRPRTLLESLALIERRFQPFPNVAAGAYCSLTQSLRLDGFEDAVVKEALGGDVSASSVVLPVLVHECQHMVDHLCTLFGRKLLAQTYAGIEARLSGRNTLFTAVSELFRTVGEVHRNDYFFELYRGADAPRKPGEHWEYRFSTGLQLDLDGRELPDRPLFFVRFDHVDAGPVARVPISVAALLEARAMAAEVRAKTQVADRIADTVDRQIYLNGMEAELDQMLYEPLFVKYTVAAHTAANLLGGNNLVSALEQASELAWLCLMMPSDLFEKVRVPEYLPGEEVDPGEARRRSLAGLKRCDRGHLFLVLATNIAQRGGLRRPSNLLTEALEASNLPPLPEVLGAAGRELVQASRSTTGGRFQDQYARVVALGDAYIVDAVRDTAGVLTQMPRLLPPLILREAGAYAHGQAAWTPEHHAAWVDACGTVTNRFNEFVDACGLYR